MSTPKFIFLTPAHHAGMRERVNANRIMTYGPAAGENGSRILFSDVEGLEHYAETPEQIDAMLGVTRIDLKPLERLLRSLGFAEWATPEGAQACLEEALKLHGEAQKTLAAISAATGTGEA